MPKKIIAITGPTASGKTSLAVQVAEYFETQIVSFDSRQFFKELSIGTAKPTTDEMGGIQHYFINSHSIKEHYTVGDFEKECTILLEKLFLNHDIIVMVGGSGLYLKAVLEGLDHFPDINPEIRPQLIDKFDKHGIESLQSQLLGLDPQYYEIVDLHNHQRLIRALEVCLSTGKPFSSFRTNQKKENRYNTLKIGIDLQRELLYDRINLRVDLMMKKGLLEEVKSLADYKTHNALQTVGYKELFDHLDGKHTLDEAIAFIKQNTRRYAKRQLTWFKKDKETHWIKNPVLEEVLKLHL